MPQLKSICVYCGSSSGRLETYAASAKALAESLVARNIKLVYGGASIGLMGQLADQVLSLGGEVIGVIPEALAHKEVIHENLTERYITQSMHERKLRMSELSDGFIALPGGIGTLEELFEIWTWAQLGLHQKPCGILNIEGYYDTLLQFLDHILAEKFVKERHRKLLIVESNPQKLLDRYSNYQAVEMKQWVNKDEV